MKTFDFTFENVVIKQTEDGIFVGNRLFLNACIEKITYCYHFTSYTHYTKTYQIELIARDSCFPTIPIVLKYDKEQPNDFFKQLKSNQLKSNFSPQDSIIVWNQLVINKDTALLNKNPLLSSDNCGWIRFKNNLYYMTSKFAISKDGPIYEYHCNNPDAEIIYNPKMPPNIAFDNTKSILFADFQETIPILITQVLSLLFPIIRKKKLYPIPCLFLSGETSTGKTQLALKIGTLFGTSESNGIRNFMILQNNIREFNRRQKGFSDTTFILDDARIPKSQTLCRSITDVIEFCGRASFDKSDSTITPIITGEPQIFNGQLDSLKNRFIEIYLPFNEEAISYRKFLIEKLDEKPKALKTCLVYFIRFICRNANNPIIDDIINRAEKEFYSLSTPSPLRSQDNLLMHYIGLSIFLYYGRTECQFIGVQKYQQRYEAILKNIQHYTHIQTEDGQVKIFQIFLLYLIDKKKLRIYRPKAYTYDILYNAGNHNPPRKNLDVTYAHYAVIDSSCKFSGIYIDKCSSIPGCEKKFRNTPILLLNRQELFYMISKVNDDLINDNFIEGISTNPYIDKPLYLSERSLIRLLAKQGILCTEERAGKDIGLKNYSFKYPHWIDNRICLQSTIGLDISKCYINEFIPNIIESPESELPPKSLYLKPKSPYPQEKMEEFFKDIRPFL